ncbi:leucine-rich repeat domain-containing protein [Winogradskyella psychrotolerans]|uniref:leucine-rich repeat domain-containing protein n=1 Tax=Winogradskyella psychrotolerans TaxID=1344585 RepID=UPI001C067FDB|nr:leucine-rich repeat domain-containing protein [Winogradskyella psychrotolerans]MBU2929107.1 leucine-rich repeat domain-containing protein [Winogradskyella psychrotolerans]
MKTKLTLFIALLLSAVSFAQTTFTDGDFTYEVISTSSAFAKITGTNLPSGTLSNLVIPATANDGTTQFQIISVGNDAFNGNALTSVTIPTNIVTIEEAAFANNSLTTVSIPDSVTLIERNAFVNNQLTTLDLGEGVETLGSGAFFNNSLTTITLPASIISIANGVFRINLLETITVLATNPPTADNSANDNSFGDRTRINVTVPNTALDTYLGESNWNSFFSINGQYTGVVGFQFDKDGFTYSVTSSDAPNELTIVDTSNSGAIDIPEIVTENEIDFTTKIIGFNALNTKQITSVSIPNSIETIKEGALANNFLTTVSIPNSVVTIERNAFFDNTLNSLDLGDGVETIGSGAFFDNVLTDITLPASVTSIANGVFRENPLLATITILATNPPTADNSANDNSFGDRTRINVTVPNAAFNAYLGDSNWNDFFSINGQYTGVVPFQFDKDGFTYSVTSSDAPNELTVLSTVNTGAIVIPEVVTENEIDFTPTVIAEASLDNEGLTSVSIPDSVTLIERNAFANNQLTSVDLGEGVVTLGSGAFINNQLTAITLPASVTDIANGVFRNNLLETITVLATNPPTADNSADDNSFGDRSNIIVTVPVNAINTYLGDSNWEGFFGINGQYTGVIPFEFDNNGFTYRITAASPNELTVLSTSNSGEIVIPAVVTENDIDFTPTVIGQASLDNEGLTSVSIPNTIETIEESAFAGNSLTTVSIPDSVTLIERNAFVNNQLTTLDLGEGVETLGSGAFFNNQLTTITLPASITSIANGVFRNNLLETITVLATNPPTADNSADDNSFGDRTRINVTVPNTAIDTYLSNTNWEGFFSINGQYTGPLGFLFTLGGIDYEITSGGVINTVTVVANVNSGTITIPSEVQENNIPFVPTVIGLNSFNNQQITSVSLPNTIETIEEGAFANNSLTTVSIPDSVTLIEKNAFSTNQLTTLDLGEGVVTLNSGAFINNQLTAITLPASIADIANGVFRNNLLETITVLATNPPTADNSADDNSFGDRSNIAVTVPEVSLNTYLSDPNWEGFFGINDQFTGGVGFEFDNNGFTYRITSLTPNEVTIIATENSGDIIIPEIVTENEIDFTTTIIGDLSFGSKGLTSVSIPDTIVEIERLAFASNDLTSVIIPDSVTVIGEGAFTFNELTTVSIPDSVTEIVDDAFVGNALTTVDLGEGVVTLGDDAFRGNQLTAITLPASVTTIGSRAFRNNPLATVTVLATNPPTTDNSNNVDNNSFGTRDLINVTVPDNPTTIQAYIDSTDWDGFFSINGQYVGDLPFQFNKDGITYIATSSDAPNELTVLSTDNGGAIVIPEIVTENSIDFIPTIIEQESLDGESITSVSIPNSIVEIREGAFINNFLTTVSIPDSVTLIERNAFANNVLTSVDLGEGVVTLESGAFINNQLTAITLPASIVSIANGVFRNNLLETITVLATNPPDTDNSADDNSFGDRTGINVTVPDTALDTYLGDSNWSGFFSINGQFTGVVPFQFDKDGFTYSVTSSDAPNELTIVDTSNSGAIVIPEVVTENEIDFTPTVIAVVALNNKQITSVSIPNTIVEIRDGALANNFLTTVSIPDSVIEIERNAFFNNPTMTTLDLGEGVATLGSGAFLGNDLKDITLPASITDIANGVFRNNPLETVTVLAINPPTTDSTTSDNSFGDRSGIDLFVPEGRLSNYVVSGQWDGFNSISEITIDNITVAPKVFLQGASLNPFTGEEDLMRDDLRVTNLIPVTSPYSDGLTADSTVFDITGNDAIVDWVFVELRDATNNTNSVASQSALLQRDGDVVDTDGVSPLSFNALTDNYFVVIKHRNHLGIMTANTFALSATVSSIDFTDANNPITFGTNAQTTFGMPAGSLGLWAGNINGDGVVQFSGATPDASGILANVLNDTGNFLNFSTFVINGYSTNDIDMNGNAQYEGGAADAPLILQNVLAHPSNFLNFSTFEIQEQLPVNITNMSKQNRFINKVKTQIKF